MTIGAAVLPASRPTDSLPPSPAGNASRVLDGVSPSDPTATPAVVHADIARGTGLPHLGGELGSDGELQADSLAVRPHRAMRPKPPS